MGFFTVKYGWEELGRTEGRWCKLDGFEREGEVYSTASSLLRIGFEGVPGPTSFFFLHAGTTVIKYPSFAGRTEGLALKQGLFFKKKKKKL